MSDQNGQNDQSQGQGDRQDQETGADPFGDGFVEDEENLREDIALVAGDDDPVPEEVRGFDIDITEGDGPLLEGGDDVDTGSAGGRRAGL